MPRAERANGQRLLGCSLRLAAIGALIAVASVVLTTVTAYRAGQVDPAGVVLVGLGGAAVLLVAWRLWLRGGLQIALAGEPSVAERLPASPASGVAGGGSTEQVVRVDEVTVRYGLRVALRAVSFAVGRGEIVGLLGPNGAGKTTAVDVCCGLLRPEAGQAWILGRPCLASDRELRRAIGVVPQETGLYPELTAAEYLRLFATMYDVGDGRRRSEQLLRLMELWDRRDSRIGGFSGGMKRRLALARALLHDPPVLFLDEPTLGVDVHVRRVLWDHVARLRDEGRSVLLTTNYLEEATALCDRVVILADGVVVADASPAALQGQSGSTLTLETSVPDRVAAAVAEQLGLPVTVDGPRVAVSLSQDRFAADVVQLAAQVGEVTSLRTAYPSLEEVFLRLTGRELRE